MPHPWGWNAPVCLEKDWSLGWWKGSCLSQRICTHTWVVENCLCNWASNLSKSRYSNSVESLIMGWQNGDMWLLFWKSSTALANNIKDLEHKHTDNSDSCDSSLISYFLFNTNFLHPDPENLDICLSPDQVILLKMFWQVACMLTEILWACLQNQNYNFCKFVL